MASTRIWLLPLALVAALSSACSTPQAPDPRYRPSQNVLEVLAVLRRHIPDDTYRFPPARDFSGRNVYRSTLLRLENIERVHAESLRAGHWTGVIAFARGRALERLRAFDLAAESYREAARVDSTLAAEAERSAAIVDALHESTQLAFDPEFSRRAEARSSEEVAAEVLNISETRMALLKTVKQDVLASHYEGVVTEEIERADQQRARYFVTSRRLRPDGNVRAVSELQRLVTHHRDSKNRNRHILELADLYADLSQEYVEENPPASLLFDPATFQELVESASRLYEAVANQDGTVEKLEAARRLEAFIAFTLRIDRDRFTP